MAIKSNFEKAKPAFSRMNVEKQTASIQIPDHGSLRFEVHTGHIEAYAPDGRWLNKGPNVDDVTVGEIMQFAINTTQIYALEFRKMILGEPALCPGSLAGSASGKGRNFEEALMDAAARMEKDGQATMGRYPVASVMMKGSKFPMQIPSLPDFEGVLSNGDQFIFEAKVCGADRFRISKVFIKHKQVRHMLKRDKFNVPCYLILHFNERLGKTFYDPAFTVAIPVTASDKGGWPVWEMFANTTAKEKDKEFDSITRAMARKMGIPIHWATPPRCKKAYPDLGAVLFHYDR